MENIMPLQNTRFLDALAQKPVDRFPLWMMRQAGRYLPEYLELRKREPNFLDFCYHIDLVTEVTVQPIDRFGFDAAILFSDILVLPKAMGVDLSIVPNVGPTLYEPIVTQKAVDKLHQEVYEETKHVYEAVASIKKALNNRVPLIGFAGSPWTVATYCVDGGSKTGFHVIKKLMYSEPTVLHALLQKLTDATIFYLIEQIKAGVDAVQVFDSWGGALSTNAYQLFSLQYMKQIVNALKKYCQENNKNIPIILFTKGGGQWLDLLVDTGADALGLDWTVDLTQARQNVGKQVALQGNLDPAVLLSTPQGVEQEVKRICEAAGSAPGFVFNLGHGIDRTTPIENVEALVKAVHTYGDSNYLKAKGL
jgi:uroporphyrinogen decarboxylase